VLDPVLDVVSDGVEGTGDGDVAGGGGGIVRVVSRGPVLGDAEGAGRVWSVSLTRSLRSVHPASTPVPSAMTQTPVSNLFIVVPPRGFDPRDENATGVPRTAGLRYARRERHTCEGDFSMKLEGSHDIPVPRERVWNAFQDPETLRQAIPGCEKLEAVAQDEYRATLKVGVAAVKGTFEGKVRLFDKTPPNSYRMAVEGSGGPGFIRGETQISLSDAEGGTRVSYVADVQIGGLIAGVGQRMLGGVSKMMADQFFNRMSQLLQGQSA
jgi:uncharacterized protein